MDEFYAAAWWILQKCELPRVVIATVSKAETHLLVVDGVDAMARAITRLAQDPALAQRLGSEGQDMVAKHFSPEIHHAEMTALYKTL